jgi:hypothetical protein
MFSICSIFAQNLAAKRKVRPSNAKGAKIAIQLSRFRGFSSLKRGCEIKVGKIGKQPRREAGGPRERRSNGADGRQPQDLVFV